jgi:hypothetical protein
VRRSETLFFIIVMSVLFQLLHSATLVLFARAARRRVIPPCAPSCLTIAHCQRDPDVLAHPARRLCCDDRPNRWKKELRNEVASGIFVRVVVGDLFLPACASGGNGQNWNSAFAKRNYGDL